MLEEFWDGWGILFWEVDVVLVFGCDFVVVLLEYVFVYQGEDDDEEYVEQVQQGDVGLGDGEVCLCG